VPQYGRLLTCLITAIRLFGPRIGRCGRRVLATASLDASVGATEVSNWKCSRAAGDFPAARIASCQEPAEGVTGEHQGSHQIRVRIGSTEGYSAPESVSSAADFTS
jgi:hypothetical protein